MKIISVCGSGLGSSFLLEMNIKKVLKDNNITSVELDHSDLASITEDQADYFVMMSDLAPSCSFKNVIGLKNIMDLKEIEEKILPLIK